MRFPPVFRLESENSLWSKRSANFILDSATPDGVFDSLENELAWHQCLRMYGQNAWSHWQKIRKKSGHQ